MQAVTQCKTHLVGSRTFAREDSEIPPRAITTVYNKCVKSNRTEKTIQITSHIRTSNSEPIKHLNASNGVFTIGSPLTLKDVLINTGQFVISLNFVSKS